MDESSTNKSENNQPRIPEIFFSQYENTEDHCLEIEKLTYLGYRHCAELPLSGDVSNSYRALVFKSMERLARLGGMQEQVRLYSHVNNLMAQELLSPTEFNSIMYLLRPFLNAPIQKENASPPEENPSQNFAE